MLTRIALLGILCTSTWAQDIRVLTLDPTRTHVCGAVDFNVATGNGYATVRSSLLSGANFGAGGTVGRAVQFLPSVPEITPTALQGADVVLMSSNFVGLRICEVLDLAEFVAQGGGLFVFQNRAPVVHAEAYGASADGLVGNSPAMIVDPSSAVANGPFGSVSGSLGPLAFHTYFTDVGPNGNSVVDTDGPVLVEFDHGSGRAILVGDEEWCLNVSENGCAAGQLPDAARLTLFLNAFTSVIPSPGFQYVPNPQSIGSIYCNPSVANSMGWPASICALGSATAADNDVLLVAERMPENQFGYFLNGPAQGQTMPPVSSGVLCLAGGIGRYNQSPLNTGAARRFELALDLTNTPTPGGSTSILAGQTWNFQAWYRDGGTNNFTDAVSILFQ